MKRLKRAAKGLAIFLASLAAAVLFWFCAGLFYAPDNMAYEFESYLPEHVRTYVVLGDNAWHWYPWGLAEVTETDISPGRFPTFEYALAEAIILDRLYEEAIEGYDAPANDEDLKGLQYQILDAFRYFLVDWNIGIISAPDQTRFEKYIGYRGERLAGEYVNVGSFDLVTINERYRSGSRWARSIMFGTLVHELIHAQGPANAERSDLSALVAFATSLNHHNESIVQLRTLEVVALMRRYGHAYYEAAYYDDLQGWALSTAYFLMMRERGCPWTDYPLVSSIQAGWMSYLKNDAIGRAIDEKEIDPPPVDLCHYASKSRLEQWIIDINGWLHAQHTKNWERDYETVLMNLYPTTPERRARRRGRRVILEQNPWFWSAACYRYWYVPYYQLQMSAGNEGVLSWQWTIEVPASPFGPVRVPYYNTTNMLDAVYYYQPIQEDAESLIRNYPTKWVLQGLGIEYYYGEEPDESLQPPTNQQ